MLQYRVSITVSAYWIRAVKEILKPTVCRYTPFFLYLITGVLIQQMIHLEHASAATTQHSVSDLDLQIIMITRITL